MTGLMLRSIAVLLVTAALSLLYWLKPGLTLAMLGITTPEATLLFAGGLGFLGLIYLIVQGYPLGYSDIGSPGSHNLDQIISVLPGFPAAFGFVTTMTNLWPLSLLNLVIAGFVMGLVIYDAWILGGAANKILYLTDELKSSK